MAYDYWADYDKHFKAFLAGRQSVDAALGELQIRQTRFDDTMSNEKDLMTRHKEKSGFLSYLDTVAQAIRIAEQQARNAMNKLQVYIRNVKDFDDSGGHFRNLENARTALREQEGVIGRIRSAAIRRN